VSACAGAVVVIAVAVGIVLRKVVRKKVMNLFFKDEQ
jgi:hypothetical protein